VNWIRIARGMKDDPRIFTLAAACKVRPAEAVGLIVNVLVELPDHARDGDLSGVPAGTVEAWARWHGRPGTFDAAFRDSICEGGKVRSWEKHNGAAIREADRKREAAIEWREKRKRGGSPPPPNPPRSGYVADTPRAPNPERSVITGRDGTGRNEEQRQTHDDDTRETPLVRVENPPAPGNRTETARHGTNGRRAMPGDQRTARGPQNAAQAPESLAFDHPVAQGAYAETRRVAPNPTAFDAMLRTIAEPITGGPAYTWPEIGAALVELAPQGGVPNAAAIRAFCRRVRAGEAAPSGGDDADAVIARSFAKAEAELRAQQQGAA
jgi:hypothetical protein